MPPLTPKQITVINELISGKPIARVARDVGINEKSIDRWLRSHEGFCQAYEDRKADLLEHGYLRALNAVDDVLDVMLGILRDADSSNRDRIAAGKAILGELDRFEAIDNRLQMRELAISQQLILSKEEAKKRNDEI
jgi:hypothetical protein